MKAGQTRQYKRNELKLNYPLSKTEAPSKELIEKTCSIFRAEGLTAYDYRNKYISRIKETGKS